MPLNRAQPRPSGRAVMAEDWCFHQPFATREWQFLIAVRA